VYFVLAAKYESWRLPMAVILVVPMCLLAAVTGMTIARLTSAPNLAILVISA
jgi:multidrug efflux pump subunit AcrB